MMNYYKLMMPECCSSFKVLMLQMIQRTKIQNCPIFWFCFGFYFEMKAPLLHVMSAIEKKFTLNEGN